MKIDLEKLIDLAKQETKQDNSIFDKMSDVMKFVHHFKIKDGEHVVSSRMMFKAYKEWSKVATSVQKFVKELQPIFQEEKKKGVVCFRINYRPIELLNAVDNDSRNIVKHGKETK